MDKILRFETLNTGLREVAVHSSGLKFVHLSSQEKVGFREPVTVTDGPKSADLRGLCIIKSVHQLSIFRGVKCVLSGALPYGMRVVEPMRAAKFAQGAMWGDPYIV
ncbi:MAG: hypothetical protein U5K36_06440 [Roseovarius sp.]|nr:hypothetical protein [Roseovarius sp.]